MSTPRLARRAAASTVGTLFAAAARFYHDRVAIEDAALHRSYGDLDERVNRVAHALATLDPRGSRRFAILSENRADYVEVQLAAAKLGAVIGCLNWRLTAPELSGCIALIEPAVVLVSPRHAAKLAEVAPAATVVVFDATWEETLAGTATDEPDVDVDPEDPWLVLYTGGTTGLPKGAVLSHRAEIARMLVMGRDLGLRPGDDTLAWPPMFHMGGTEPAIHALLTGGRVIIEDGFDPDRIVARLAERTYGWVSMMPGTSAAMIAALERSGTRPRGLIACGVMPDLFPRADLARLTALLGASWCNTFGSTEAGTPPLSGDWIAPGDAAFDLGKRPSPLTEIRLLGADGVDVAQGEVGELLMRGPTLFSGYWNNPEANAETFRDGWFHSGDLFRQRPDGRFDFVDRAKYMIKSGGENIYPAEIERVLLDDPRVADAVVVRARDERWGEVPIALVVPAEAALTSADLVARCRAALAGYKQPKRFIFVTRERLARSAQGKVSRQALEHWVASAAVD